MWCCHDVLGNYVSQNTRPHPNSLSLYTRPYLEKEFFASIIKGAQDVVNMQKLGQTPNPIVEVLTREKQEEL